MSTDTEIRTTMRQVADGVEPPRIDELGIDRRVRRHRLRRRAGGVAAAGAICAAVLAVPLAVQQIDSESGTAPPPFAGSVPQERPPAYFVLGSRAVMLDSDGKVHDLGTRAEAIVGTTDEGVLVFDMSSRLVHIRVLDSRSGWTFDRVDVPTTKPVDSAAVSADGARVAVVDLDLDQNVVVYDLANGDELSRTPNDRSAYVADFSDRVLYTVGDDALRLGTEEPDVVEIPVSDGPAWDSVVSANTVAVTTEESNVTTKIYDVTTGSAARITVLPGWGDLSTDGRYYLAAYDEGSRALLDLESGESYPVTGLEGTADQIQWLDQDTALVASGAGVDGGQVSRLYACEGSTLQCQKILESDRDLRLGH